MFLTTKLPTWVFVIAVIAIAVISLVSWRGILIFEDIRQISNEITELSRVVRKTEKAPDEFANWKIYRNEKYGWEIQYPGDWFISETDIELYYKMPSPKGPFSLLSQIIVSPDETFQSPTVITISVEDLEGAQYTSKEYLYKIYNWAESIGPASNLIISEEETEFAGIKGYNMIVRCKSCGEYMGKNLDEVDSHRVAVIRSGRAYYINSGFFTSDSQKTNQFNQILSTFKFIEAIETSDWKTYRNEEYGFEVKYPNDWKSELPETYSDRTILLQVFYKISTTQTYPDKDKPIDAYISLYILKNPKNLTLQEMFDGYYQDCLREVESGENQFGCPPAENIAQWQNIIVNDKEALRSGKRNMPEGLPTDSVYIKELGYFIVIEGTYYNLNNTYDFTPVFNQILSTFKFLD